MFSDYLGITVLLAGAVGLFSVLVRRRRRERSSWPTWLMVPLAIVLALPMGVMVADPLRPFDFMIFAMVFSRWLVALLRRERSYGWIFYLVVLIVAELSIYPLAHWYAARGH
jgi:hypothetical protein